MKEVCVISFKNTHSPEFKKFRIKSVLGDLGKQCVPQCFLQCHGKPMGILKEVLKIVNKVKKVNKVEKYRPGPGNWKNTFTSILYYNILFRRSLANITQCKGFPMVCKDFTVVSDYFYNFRWYGNQVSLSTSTRFLDPGDLAPRGSSLETINLIYLRQHTFPSARDMGNLIIWESMLFMHFRCWSFPCADTMFS